MPECVVSIDGKKYRLAETDGFLTELSFAAEEEELLPPKTSLLQRAEQELREYFKGERKEFSVPMRHGKAGFTGRVLDQLMKVPYGTLVSYQSLAKKAGNEKAARAAGQACHNNPIGIMIPCHRVVARDGNLTGYAGGMEKKRQLLQLEGVDLSNTKPLI